MNEFLYISFLYCDVFDINSVFDIIQSFNLCFEENKLLYKINLIYVKLKIVIKTVLIMTSSFLKDTNLSQIFKYFNIVF